MYQPGQFAVGSQVRYYAAQTRIEDMPLNTNKNSWGMRSLVLALLALPIATALGNWSVPPELKSKVDALGDAQRTFVTSGAAIDIIPERQLTHELQTRDTQSMSRLLDDLMAVAEQMGYSPERDMGAALEEIRALAGGG